MRDYLKRLPKDTRALIRLARDTAYMQNCRAYLVGGIVRDLILGVENLDLDIVVEADGISFAEALADQLHAKLVCHKRFGTATIIQNQHQKIDISTARSESYLKPAHLPVVRSGTLRQDLFRRDFTINAMAVSISDPGYGELIDLFGGKADLRNKKIRVLHDLSFQDDPTRILRAVRFANRYCFALEAETLKLIKVALKNKMLHKVEPQRIRDELILILKEKHVLREIRQMRKFTGFSFISPKLNITKRTYVLLRSIERQVLWFNKSYPQRRQPESWLIYLMALLDPLTEPEARALCRKLALRKIEEKRIADTLARGRRFIAALELKNINPSKIFALLEPLSYEEVIFLKAKYKKPKLQRHIEDFFKDYHGMRIHVTGSDLLRIGVIPGPAYQKVLGRILNARLDGLVKTREEEEALLKKILKIA